MAFVAIAKNAVTYLKSLAIYAKTGTVVSDKEEIHEVVGYSSMNGYLYPVKQLDGEWGNGIMKFAVWRDPVERLVSCYKNFCLEYHHQQRRYFEYLDLCREPSFPAGVVMTISDTPATLAGITSMSTVEGYAAVPPGT